MAFGEVQLLPGVNLERTPTLAQATISSCQLIRFKDGLVQKYGGWEKYYAFAVGGTPRDMHGWQDLNGDDHLSVGSTSQLSIITSGALANVTPQTKTTDFSPNFTTTINTTTVTVTDSNIANVTTFDSIFFNTPISVGGIILSGLYAITQISGVTSYTITAVTAATSSVSNAGAVPSFTTTSGSAVVTVTITAHGLAIGDEIAFPIETTGNGVTIETYYKAVTVPTADTFTINVTNEATASGSFSMNSGNCQLLYYITLGPPAAGAGYGTGTYGEGGFGLGVVGTSQTGTAITATDWTSDNWGEIGLFCPANGGLYLYDPTGGFTNTGLVPNAPIFNSGMFVSIGQQIVITYGASEQVQIGVKQDPLLISWCAVGDYTVWNPLTTNQAGSFRIPTGSLIQTGMAAPNQNLFWTDIDLWAANYQGPPFVFGFNKIGAGAGSVSRHAAQQLRGGVFWMGRTNFYAYAGGSVSVVPCPVWDFVFQNINTDYLANVRALPNTPFNEVGWAFPSSSSSTGENDSYVKFNISEPNGPWDYGTLARSSWIDQTVLGMPLGSSPGGLIYQHETTMDNDGNPMSSSFTTGYFYIAEGEEFCVVDQIIPDFKWGFYGASQNAQVQLTFNVINYPGDTVTSYGPYTVTSSSTYIFVRFRARQMSITVQSSDSGSWWRIGKVRYRFHISGRR